MVVHCTRRGVLRAGLAAGAGWSFGIRTAHAAPRATFRDPRVISHLSHRYHGWPTLTRRANGELLLVSSAGRESHVCPFGRIELTRSRDDGSTWTWPRVIIDGPLDDRDAGIVETAKGTLLATTFTSLAYEPVLASAEKSGNWAADKLKRWRAAHGRISTDAARRGELGVWMIRSTDGGITWSERYDCLVDSPHGPFQLGDGRMLYAGKDLWREGNRVGVCQSTDDGASWQWLAPIPVRDGDSHKHYHELHGVEAADGRIVVQIRNHNAKNRGETLQTESADGGKTWSVPRAIGVWGLPSHLLRLADDSLLMSYGHRRAPLGNQARISKDNGRTWSEPLLVSADGTSGDLGYPSTVQLADGGLVTAWYERLKTSPFAVLRMRRWQLEG